MWFQMYRVDGVHMAGNSEIVEFGEFSDSLRKCCVIITAFILVVLMPIYSVLTVLYSNHKYTYGWAVSAVYLSGQTPGIVLVVFFVVMFLLVTFCFDRMAANVEAGFKQTVRFKRQDKSIDSVASLL